MRVEWVHPEFLLLLLAVPAYAAWTWRGRQGGGGGARTFPLPRAATLAGERLGAPFALAYAPELLRALCFVLLVLALARPRAGAAAVEETARGVPMVVALDVSSSMLAEDFQPRNRLEVAKETVARFIGERADDPIGLVAFAAEALSVVPITTDRPVLLNALSALRVGLLEDGTAIGDGLAAAANRLRRVPGRSRVVILMSDGESNRGTVDPVAAARAAAAFGIRVYTIGVGSRGVARVPVERAPGGLQYAERAVGLDEALLQRIATLTGGQYFRATNPQALREIYREIDRLVKSPVDVRVYMDYTEWYPALVLAGALVLLLEWLLRASRWGRVP